MISLINSINLIRWVGVLTDLFKLTGKTQQEQSGGYLCTWWSLKMQREWHAWWILTVGRDEPYGTQSWRTGSVKSTVTVQFVLSEMKWARSVHYLKKCKISPHSPTRSLVNPLNCIWYKTKYISSMSVTICFTFMFQLQAVQNIVSSCEKALKLVSDFIAEM